MVDLSFGDVIYVDRGFYKHFGVYSGNKNVIHYTKDESSCLDGIIRETSLKKFLEGKNECFICNFDERGKKTSESAVMVSSIQPMSDSEKEFLGKIFNPVGTLLKIFSDVYYDRDGILYSPEETVQRARNCIGKKGYDLLCHNCEHFAIWCKTGLEKSEQVKHFIDSILESPSRVISVSLVS